MLVWLTKMVFLLLYLLKLVKGPANLFTCLLCLLKLVKAAVAREECNKYDPTIVPCFRLVNHNDSSRQFAISSAHIFAVLWVELQNSK